MQTSRRIVIVGAGRTGTRILAGLPAEWRVTVIDHSEVALATLSGERKITKILGDASSRVVLERAGLDPAATLVLTTPDDAVNLEVARLAREEWGIEEIVGLLDQDGDTTQRIGAVDRAGASATQVLQRIGGLAVGPRGRGELLHVTVLPGSSAIGRPLREVHRGEWLVAMVYRGESLIVPRGDTVMHEGDRVLLAGQPPELSPVATFFRGGEATFPASWGARIGVMDPSVEPAADWLARRTTATNVVLLPPDAPLDRDGLRAQDIGCLVVPPRPIPWHARLGVTAASWPARLLAAGVPVLVVRGQGAPDRVVVGVPPHAEARTITGAGIDLARQAEVALTLLTVLPPNVSPESDEVGDRTASALRYARLHGLEPIRTIERGNPIERIRALTRPTDLLVVGHSPARRNTLLTPDISLFLMHDAPATTLFVPWTPEVA